MDAVKAHWIGSELDLESAAPTFSTVVLKSLWKRTMEESLTLSNKAFGPVCTTMKQSGCKTFLALAAIYICRANHARNSIQKNKGLICFDCGFRQTLARKPFVKRLERSSPSIPLRRTRQLHINGLLRLIHFVILAKSLPSRCDDLD